jgi:hypothetical protein
MSGHIDLTDFQAKKKNLKSTNIRWTTIIQIQNMNLKLNMNDINKMLANAHFKCKCYQKNDVKKQHIFVEKCLYKAVGNLSVMPSLLPHVL